MKNIIVLGDSFTYGQGCSDKEYYYDPDLKCTVGNSAEFYTGPSRYCWASLLGGYYAQYNIMNLAHPGNDNAYMLNEAYQRIDENTALVIFAGTMPPRMHIPNAHSEGVGTWVMSNIDRAPSIIECKGDVELYQKLRDIHAAKKSFLKHLYSDEMFAIYALNALYAAYGLARRYNAKFIWSGFPHEDKKHEDYADKLSDLKMISPTFWHRNVQPELKSKDNHLNNLGHEVYFNEVVLPKVIQIME